MARPPRGDLMRGTRKTRVLRALAQQKQVRSLYAALDVLEYIKELELVFEALSKEYKNITNQIQVPTEVRVKKVEKGFLIQVSCKRGRHVLVTLLQAFEEIGINILQAEVSSDKCFTMDVFGQTQGENLDAVSIQQAVLKALQNLMLEGSRSD